MSLFRLRIAAILAIITALGLLVAGCHHKKPASKNSGYNDTVQTTVPLAYYRLESTSGTSEIGGTTYKAQGGVTLSSDCAPVGIPENKCLELNGKDGWILTTQKGGIDKAGSMAVWVKLASLPSEAKHFFYVAGESEIGNDFDLQFETDDTLRFYTAAGSHLTYKPDAKTLVNQWHMIAVTMDTSESSRALYWDGQQVATDKDAGKPKKNNALSMGASTVFGGRYLHGTLDEVVLWDRALTKQEIAALYQPVK